MKKLTTALATGLLALTATAEAGSKDDGSATTDPAGRGGYVPTAVVAAPADKDIVDTAVAAGSFKTLVAAVKSAKTVNGKEVKIKVSDKGVMVDAAKVVTTDIEASNGVIHVIDSVILP